MSTADVARALAATWAAEMTSGKPGPDYEMWITQGWLADKLATRLMPLVEAADSMGEFVGDGDVDAALYQFREWLRATGRKS
jgi:hypothetical protein